MHSLVVGEKEAALCIHEACKAGKTEGHQFTKTVQTQQAAASCIKLSKMRTVILVLTSI